MNINNKPVNLSTKGIDFLNLLIAFLLVIKMLMKENQIKVISKVCPTSGWVIKSIIIGKIIKKLKKYLR